MKQRKRSKYKHLCPGCGAFVKWALMFCFGCNDKLRTTGGTQLVEGAHEYPAYNYDAPAAQN